MVELNLPVPSSNSSSPSVAQAEQAVNSSIARFEAAMENLAAKVEDTTARVQDIVETAKRPVEDLIVMKNQVQAAVTPLVRDVRANPGPWLMTGALLCLGFLFFKYRQVETAAGAERALN